MKRRQTVSQPGLGGLRGVGPDTATPNADLIGRSFHDGTSGVRVIGVSRADPSQVVVARDSDGRSWTIHAGIVRMIVTPGRRRRAA